MFCVKLLNSQLVSFCLSNRKGTTEVLRRPLHGNDLYQLLTTWVSKCFLTVSGIVFSCPNSNEQGKVSYTDVGRPSFFLLVMV